MSYDFGPDPTTVHTQYRLYATNPSSVDGAWQAYFTALPPHAIDELKAATAGVSDAARGVELAWKLSRMAAAYRSRGHYYASIDPLGLTNEPPTQLECENFGIADADLDVLVMTDIPGHPQAPPRHIAEHLRRTYCGTVGYEVMHVEDTEERRWLLERIEGASGRPDLTREQKVWVLQRLTDAQELERFLHSQYVGAKRFSLEGLEAMIPMIHHIIDRSGDAGVKDVYLGMAHRGRLNVLVNIMRKSLRELFTAFNDQDSQSLVGRGDVKYHLGWSTKHATPGGQSVDVSLAFNPSHLEFVDPVVVGRARAKLDDRSDATGASVLPVMIHGDSAFMGQGIVAETLNLAELEGYRTGGTVHIVANNQVGFTTSPSDARSSRYASDLVRFMRIPVFHVSADDIEAVMWVAWLAAEYRRTFRRDVCIDLVGYRRYGHNEGDEPRFTQPEMYRVIDAHQRIRDRWASELIASGDWTEADDTAMLEQHRAEMMDALQESKAHTENTVPGLEDEEWTGYFGGAWRPSEDVSTAVSADRLASLLDTLTDLDAIPEPHPKVARVYDRRAKMLDVGQTIDWGGAEMLAFASLVNEGRRVRLTGQDARRGTFSHRHAYIVDGPSGERYTTLDRVASGGGSFEAWDSPLSEAACLGFEYGYSLGAPDALVIWEAQFGDFANGAQVIIDQFISSGEDKWGRLTGLTMLLPHGFEGMGPEHSYARLGRFLQLCAEDNMQVCDCTTPAQIFHLLRRQALTRWRKPLVVMSPKSLLRHKRCVSRVSDLTDGFFSTVIGDQAGTAPDGIRRVLLCSGRVYFDLEQEREKRGANDVHIVRLEQLYPLDADRIAAVLSQYRPGTELVWVQDEPWNMGAWYFIKARFQAMFGNELPIQCVARAESASPATGSSAAHRLEHGVLMEAAFGGVPSQASIGSD